MKMMAQKVIDQIEALEGGRVEGEIQVMIERITPRRHKQELEG